MALTCFEAIPVIFECLEVLFASSFFFPSFLLPFFQHFDQVLLFSTLSLGLALVILSYFCLQSQSFSFLIAML